MVKYKCGYGYNAGLKDYILKQMNTLKLKLEMSTFEYALNWGKFVIFFDGYDELPLSGRSTILKAIMDFCTKYNYNDYILTSRPTDDLLGSSFVELSINKLSKRKALSLIRKISFSGDDELTKQSFLEALDNSLYDSHTTFAETPLLLVLMLMMYREYSEIPQKLHLFYEQAYVTLYSRHDSTKGGFNRPMFCNISSDTFRSVLEAFSFITYIQNQFSFSHNFIEATMRTVKNTLPANISKEFNTQDFMNDLLQSVTILLRDGDLFTFIHRTFQEYFSVCYIQKCSDDEQKSLLNNIFDQKSDRRLNDPFFSMLFDLDRERITANFLIDKMLDIKKATKYEDDIDIFNGVNQFLINTDSVLWYGRQQQQLSDQFIILLKSLFSDNNTLCTFNKDSFYTNANKNPQYIDLVYFIASNYIEEFIEEYSALLNARTNNWESDQDNLKERIGRKHNFQSGFVSPISNIREKRCMTALARQDITIINYLFSMLIIDELASKSSKKMQLLGMILGKEI